MSTLAFTVCFAVWTIFSIIGIRIKQELGLNGTSVWPTRGTPILTGSLARLVLGIWTGRYGGRVVFTFTMLAAAAATFLLAHAATYAQMLFAALGVGLAGGSFAVGVAYVSRFLSGRAAGDSTRHLQQPATLNPGNHQFLAPFVLLAWGWQAVAQVWAGALAVMAVVFWFCTSDGPAFRLRQTGRTDQKSFGWSLLR